MTGCTFPVSIRGISSSGTNNETSGVFAASIQSFKTGANLGREMMLELGRRGPYFRFVSFPVEVSTTIDIMAKDGDMVMATE